MSLPITIVGPDEAPVITAVEVARSCPELAILSAFLRRGTGSAAEIAEAAKCAARRLDGGSPSLYTDLIYKWLPEAARHAPEESKMSLEALLENYEWQSDFAKKLLAEGEAKGEARGKAEGRAESVLTVLRSRGLPVEAEHEERILACGDVEQLDRWLQRAATASSPDEIFAD